MVVPSASMLPAGEIGWDGIVGCDRVGWDGMG